MFQGLLRTRMKHVVSYNLHSSTVPDFPIYTKKSEAVINPTMNAHSRYNPPITSVHINLQTISKKLVNLTI